MISHRNRTHTSNRIRNFGTGLFEPLESRRLLSTYVVSAASGADTNAGTSDAAAFKTLQKAANTVRAGDTVYVRAGTYAAGMNLINHAGGTAAAPIRFLADAGAVITHSATAGSNADAAAINIENAGGWFVIDGFTVRGDGSMTKAGIRSAGSANVVIRDCDVSAAPTGIFASRSDNILVESNVCHDNTDQHGIYVNGSANYVIRGNTTFGNNWNGIHTNVMDGVNQVNTGGLIENNVVRNNALAGFDFTGMSNATVRNNLVYGNGRHAAVLQNSNGSATVACHDVTFVNNTFDARAGSSAYAIQISSLSAQPAGSSWAGNDVNVTLFNNVLLANTASGNGSVGDLSPAVAPSFRSDENVVVDAFRTGGTQRPLSGWRGAIGGDANSLVSSATSLFVDTASGNYQLKAGASAIDAGVPSFNGRSAPSTDFQGEARPQGAGYDIGYDEVGSSVQAPVQAPVPAPTPPPTDTTAPTVTNRTPAAGATGVDPTSNVTATFSEPIDPASVTLQLRDASGTVVPAATGYDTATRTITLDPTSALAAQATYTATLSGARDAAGNTAAATNWSFTTAAPAQASGLYDDFSGSSLGSTWTATRYSSGSTVAVSGGTLSNKSTQIRSVGTVTGAVEGRLQFTGRWQAFGMATDLSTASGNSWAIFSTKDTATTLYARTNVNGTSNAVSLGATPVGFHTYRVEPIAGGGGFNFLIDGVRVASIKQAIPTGTPVKLVISDMTGQAALGTDWVRADGQVL
jgi:parallel beta-helix repeat protein